MAIFEEEKEINEETTGRTTYIDEDGNAAAGTYDIPQQEDDGGITGIISRRTGASYADAAAALERGTAQGLTVGEIQNRLANETLKRNNYYDGVDVDPRLGFDSGKDYSKLMERAANSGDYAAAAYYEQQRNKKIDYLNQQGQNTGGYEGSAAYADYVQPWMIYDGYTYGQDDLYPAAASYRAYLERRDGMGYGVDPTLYTDETLGEGSQGLLDSIQYFESIGDYEQANALRQSRLYQKNYNTGEYEQLPQADFSGMSYEDFADFMGMKTQAAPSQETMPPLTQEQIAQRAQAQDLYRQYMNARRLLMQQLSAEGYTGGAVENALVKLDTSYADALTELNPLTAAGQVALNNQESRVRIPQQMVSADYSGGLSGSSDLALDTARQRALQAQEAAAYAQLLEEEAAAAAGGSDTQARTTRSYNIDAMPLTYSTASAAEALLPQRTQPVGDIYTGGELNFEADEGVWTWNGGRYNGLKELEAGWQDAGLSEADRDYLEQQAARSLATAGGNTAALVAGLSGSVSTTEKQIALDAAEMSGSISPDQRKLIEKILGISS